MLRRYLPKSLYARVTLIVVLPIFLTQALVTYIFFARHWDLVTANMSENVAGQIAMVTRLYGEADNDAAREKLIEMALDDLHLRVHYEPESPFPDNNLLDPFNVYNATLKRRLRYTLKQPYWLNTQSWPDDVEIREDAHAIVRALNLIEAELDAAEAAELLENRK